MPLPEIDVQTPPTEPGREPITLEREDVANLWDAAVEKRERMGDEPEAYSADDLREFDGLLARVEAALGYGR